MTKFLSKHILIVIVILAGALRLYGLSGNPVHLTNDEAALGYNAYSILKTGKDEHGELLPVVFKSFGDWKPGLYIYASVPFVAAFGLNEFSTRAVSAFSGILAVYLLYLIVLQLFEKRSLAILASIFLAISPWHIHFSRGAWETNFALTITLAGVYFFLRSLKEYPWFMSISAVCFALTLWTYQGAKLSTLIVLCLLCVLYLRQILLLPRKYLITSFILGFLIILPVLFSFSQGKKGRLEVYNVFSYERPKEYVDDILSQEDGNRDSLQYVLYHSEPLNFLRGILGRYFNHFSGRFLFFEGDWQNLRHSIPGVGQLLVVDFVFLLAGMIFVAKNLPKKPVLLAFLWLLLAPLPSALSRDAVHAVRAINMVVPLMILIALGGLGILGWLGKAIKNRNLLFTVYCLLFTLYLANYVYYLDQYWVHAPYKYAKHWQYGYKQMVEEVSQLQGNYEEIVVKQDYAQPYIFFLFYQKYDPVKYQSTASQIYQANEYGDVGFVAKIDNITFRDINWYDDRAATGKLFVVDPIKVPVTDSSDPQYFKLVSEIKFPDGKTAFRLLEIL